MTSSPTKQGLLDLIKWKPLPCRFSCPGSLVDYSFNKGHPTYASEAAALHNTLLLHDDIDSFTFVFEASEYTKSINFTLQHPQSEWDLNVTLFTRDNWEKAGDNVDEYVPAGSPIPAGEYKVNLPPGPLYSQIVVFAESKLQIPPTRPLGFRCLAGPCSIHLILVQ